MPNAVNDHPIGKQKLAPRFNRMKVLNIIKLATMDKMKEAEGAGGGVGGGGTAGGGGGGGTTEGGDAFHSEFYNTGRIGRRNALPDILGSHCTTTTADLPTQLGALSTSDCSTKAPNTSAGSGSPMMTNTATTSSSGAGGGGGS